MSALREWQQQFIDRVVQGDEPSLAIHRNNWRGNLRAALRAGYPVIERLVGAEFFAYCADRYIDAQPSRSSNLEYYGHAFSQFLRDFAPAQSLPYLADVAALEYAIEQMLVCPDDDASIVLQSPFPILAIWRSNQSDHADAETINLDVGGDVLRLSRAGLEVQIEKIAADAQNADAPPSGMTHSRNSAGVA